MVRAIWAGHRVLYVMTGGRVGLRTPKPDRWGTLLLRTVGRRTGEERKAILGYVEDGPDVVLMAMNGWADPEPAWWLNLQAHPDAKVDLPVGSRAVRARVADEDERPRLWAKWEPTWAGDLDAWAANRSRETQLIILEPSEGRDDRQHRERHHHAHRRDLERLGRAGASDRDRHREGDRVGETHAVGVCPRPGACAAHQGCHGAPDRCRAHLGSTALEPASPGC
jgi:deazaflavin-dependent oxidoreductase (nitroreductase family)